ncbi:MAG TPA: GNAT family N-acetyltransferase [Candidatus Deferrimicrobium sp.]|nr:GNAT family N-acetyltransferase [Candidatus Deferrimicrobium sp.]
MLIRNVKVSDSIEITKLAENCAPLIRASVVGTYEFLARCFSNTFLVYEEDMKILGFLVGFPNTAVKGEFWIYQVCICDKLRGKSIGSQLFQRLFEQLRAEGYTRVRSHYKFENTHSKNLHEKFGMKQCGQDERGWFCEVKFVVE